MKKFRRISTLALVIVLVCLFSASAFAIGYTDNQDYADGISVCAYAEIWEKSTLGDVYIDSGDAYGNYLSVELSYRYYLSKDNPHYTSGTNSAEVENDWYVSTAYNNTSMYRMLSATYVHYASFLTSTGTQTYTYTHDPIFYIDTID